METYIVCGFRRLQSKHSTSQCNVQRQPCCGRRRKHWTLKLQFSSWFSIHLLLHRLYRFNYQINSIYKCFIIESNVLHRSVSYWEVYPAIFSHYSLQKHKGIETQLWKRNLNQLHCEVECFDCDKGKSQTMHISNLAS